MKKAWKKAALEEEVTAWWHVKKGSQCKRVRRCFLFVFFKKKYRHVVMFWGWGGVGGETLGSIIAVWITAVASAEIFLNGGRDGCAAHFPAEKIPPSSTSRMFPIVHQLKCIAASDEVVVFPSGRKQLLRSLVWDDETTTLLCVVGLKDYKWCGGLRSPWCSLYLKDPLRVSWNARLRATTRSHTFVFQSGRKHFLKKMLWASIPTMLLCLRDPFKDVGGGAANRLKEMHRRE